MNLTLEFFRKSIHLLSLFFPLTYYFTNKITTLYLILFFLCGSILYEITRFINFKLPIISDLLSKIIRDKEKTNLTGASYMLISYLYLVIFFTQKIVISSMLILILADSIAALVGKSFPYKKLPFTNKTLSGSLSFFIITLIILFAYFNLNNYFALFFISVTITFAELYTDKLKIDDNISISFITSLLLYFYN